MTAIQILIALLKLFEGCKLTAYQDGSGIWTIGYGETLGVTEGMVWTQDQADQRLATRAATFLQGVIEKCPKLATEPPSRQAACASLSYEIGINGFAGSTVCRDTQAALYDSAADAFLLWDKETINGVLTVSPGILHRRRVESGVYADGYNV